MRKDAGKPRNPKYFVRYRGRKAESEVYHTIKSLRQRHGNLVTAIGVCGTKHLMFSDNSDRDLCFEVPQGKRPCEKCVR